MDYNSIIKDLEDEKIQIMKDYYYHAFYYERETFNKMINEGIKSAFLRDEKGCGNNGKYYISLTKREDCEYSAYENLKHLPMFIIDDGIKTVKARNYRRKIQYPLWFTNTILPFRDCGYDNEYQKFLIVEPSSIIGIQLNIYSNYIDYHDNDFTKRQLLIIKQLVKDLYIQQIDLPIVDCSTFSKINKEKILSLKLN